MTKLVYAVAKHLLALFVDGVQVVYYEDFLLPRNGGRCLTESTYLVPVEGDSLLLKGRNVHNIVSDRPISFSVVQAHQCTGEGRFATADVSDDKNVERVHAAQRVEHFYNVPGQIVVLENPRPIL